MLTLFSFVTEDSVAAIYTPLILERPGLAVYFLSLVLIVSVALMNLVTAVLVEAAIKMANLDQEQQRFDTQRRLRQALPELLRAFHDSDKDGNGSLSREEMQKMSTQHLPVEVTHMLEEAGLESIDEVFSLLDISGDEEVSYEEFLTGFLNMLAMPMSLTTFRITKMLENSFHLLDEIKRRAESMDEKVRTQSALDRDWLTKTMNNAWAAMDNDHRCNKLVPPTPGTMENQLQALDRGTQTDDTCSAPLLDAPSGPVDKKHQNKKHGKTKPRQAQASGKGRAIQTEELRLALSMAEANTSSVNGTEAASKPALIF